MTTSNATLNPGDTITITYQGTFQIKDVTASRFTITNPLVSSGVQPPPDTQGPPAPTPPSNSLGILFSTEDIQKLPTTGAAWENVKSKAQSSWGSPNIKDGNSTHDVLTLAGALYYARTGDTAMRKKVADAIVSAQGTETGGRTLESGRNVVSYVIAADLIGLKEYDAGKNTTFKTWLSIIRDKELDGRTLVATHEKRPNNWGTHAGATRVAIDRYIGDVADLEKAAKVFFGWLGDRSVYAGFEYGELDWQSDKTKPVGINPKGATIDSKNVDGVLPDDQRRAGGFTWPPQKENYVWEALQGATVQAWLLHRAGYDVFNASDKALLRAVTWLYTVANFPPEGDDTWITWIYNKVYNTTFTTKPASIGKNMSYTDWLFV